MSLHSPGTASSDTPRHSLMGILVRREGWRLTLQGWLLALLLLIMFLLILQRTIYPFLAVTNRVPGEFLVVEGWIQSASLRQAMVEFRRSDYQKVLTSGCIAHTEWQPERKATYAHWAAAKLAGLGMPTNCVVPIPCWVEKKDRTFYSALEVRRWLAGQGLQVKSLNVLTQGPHARRTRLLFQKAFGRETVVGVIAVPDTDYDPKRWWHSSEGVREVLGETIAYVYARLFFRAPTIDLAASAAPPGN